MCLGHTAIAVPPTHISKFAKPSSPLLHINPISLQIARDKYNSSLDPNDGDDDVEQYLKNWSFIHLFMFFLMDIDCWGLNAFIKCVT